MKEERLQLVLAVAQIISSIAVVVSIILLVMEYKRANILNEKSIESQVYARVVEMNRLLIENESLAGIILAAYSTPDSLSEVERMRYLAYEHIFLDNWETMWTGYNDGLIDEKTWREWNHWFVKEVRRKPELAVSGNEKNFDAEFLDYMRKAASKKIGK